MGRVPRGRRKKLRAAVRWQLADGRNADWLRSLAEEEPDAAHLAARAEPPEDARVPDHLRDIWLAFGRLSRGRPAHAVLVATGAGMVSDLVHGGISFSAIDEYGRRFGYEGEDFVTLMRLILEMDSEWLAVVAEQREQRR